MKAFSLPAFASALLLAGCGGGDEGQRNVTSIQVGDGQLVEQLRGLDDSQRTLTLRRAVIDSGNACHRSRDSKEIGAYENLTVFNLQCERDSWAVFVAPTGDVQVRSCAHARQLGLPGCEEAADDQPAASNSTKS